MTNEATVDRFIELVCAMDLDAACELVSDDCEYDNVPLGKQYGPAGIKGLLGPMVEGLDEVEFVVHRQVAAGNVVMNERNDRFRRGDQWLDLPVVGVFELDDAGRIRLWRDYFDAASFTEQLAAFDR
jgi:limonene-1,2-epoxide hydrolase